MEFSEKIRAARLSKHWTQQEVANRLGVTLRTIQTYETGGKLPRKRESCIKLAHILDLDPNYLLSIDEDFLMQSKEQYGSRGAKQANELIQQIGGLFAGGELSEEDRDGLMMTMQEFYWKAKKVNKKYTPKKYVTDDTPQED